jgi:hypothetical protein
MIQRDETIYLVFDFFEVDLRRYIDKVKRQGLTIGHIKVKLKSQFSLYHDIHYYYYYM